MNATGYSTGALTGSVELGVSREVWMTGTTAVSLSSSVAIPDQAHKGALHQYLVPVAITPLILAPLSEVYGRRPLYLVAIFIYTYVVFYHH